LSEKTCHNYKRRSLKWICKHKKQLGKGKIRKRDRRRHRAGRRALHPCFHPEDHKRQHRPLLPDVLSERAAEILHLFLDDYTKEELSGFAKAAYSEEKFDHPGVAPVKKLKTGEFLLELWHGPTAAFKDMALQMLPHLMTAALKKTGEQREVCILVATSGDTGKAALEGFADVKGTKIVVFYPRDGVSRIQKLQMTTQKGANVGVCAIEGNFDDAQTAVKSIFADGDIRGRANEKKLFFQLREFDQLGAPRASDRLLYLGLLRSDKPKRDQKRRKNQFCVPTGNFGNILAAYFAREMGLPVNRLICASNKNRVLTDFFQSSVYDTKRKFYQTSSPSMDILISSNLERLLYYAAGQESSVVSALMQSLREKGGYRINDELRKRIGGLFAAGACDERGTAETILSVFRESNYLCDTHTAVGVNVYRDYREKTGDGTKTRSLASTASKPVQILKSVLEALNIQVPGERPRAIGTLEEAAGIEAPKPLRTLSGLPERF
jgi:threonine synthase